MNPHHPCQKEGALQAEQLFSAPEIDPLQLRGRENIADFIDQVFARSGFNGRLLAEAAQLYSQMLKENVTIGLTIAGAMTPIGMSGVVNSLIEAGFVDFIISTGANLYHDLHRPYNCPMVQGNAVLDDNDLAEAGVARIYDVFIGEDETLMATDKIILKNLGKLKFDAPFSTAALHQKLGEAVLQSAQHPERSLLATAAKHKVPIYTSSPGDSSIGMNLVVPYILDQPVPLNPILDVIESSAIVRDADKNGVIILGGGSPKNFYLQTQPTLHQILQDRSKGGHDYFIQLTVDAPHWGGLSGATPKEARSWGKIKDAHKDNVVVYSCTSISFPLLAQYVLIRNQPRPPRRLYERVPEMVTELMSIARGNRELLDQYRHLYQK
ncbi:MAG: Deoxyhypusine synthase-like protein [Phycisphaerae bacterium]|nr:Deoxyhypusine synthase-like protein [Phycisphaerae bacterium]